MCGAIRLGDVQAADRLRCLHHEPSIGSGLKFLRRTPSAREQVEALYLDTLRAASGPAAATDGKALRSGPNT